MSIPRRLMSETTSAMRTVAEGGIPWLRAAIGLLIAYDSNLVSVFGHVQGSPIYGHDVRGSTTKVNILNGLDLAHLL